jgi:hypothetical protein
MRHLDEETIHAYLESRLRGIRKLATELHLATCSSCRARLDSKGSIQDRTEGILHAAAPAGHVVPPLSELEERRQGFHQPKRPHRFLQAKLAWAATAVLALGLGWYAREFAIETERPQQLPVVETPEATSRAAEGAVAEFRERPAAEQATTAPGARPFREQGIPPVASTMPQVAAETRKDLRALSAMAVERVGAREPAAPSGQHPDKLDWTEVDRREAELRLGGPLAGIPGAHTVSVQAAQRDGITVMRTVQILASGIAVELEQTPLTSELLAELHQRERAAAPSYRTEGVSAVWNGFLVVGRGSLPADSLEGLLGRLQRAQPPKPD